jgi:hypothetical protein
MEGRLFKALAGTEQMNMGLECREGQLYYYNKPLRNHQEGLQFYCKKEGCLPGLQHYDLLTPHAISSGAKLECSICLQLERFTTEQSMTRALQTAGLDQHMVLQWQPKWWHGRVDYYFPLLQVVMQLDGSAHFVANPKTRRVAELLATDLRCNMAAWKASTKLVRIHHEDQFCPAWLLQLALMAKCSGPLLVLSPSFEYVNWKQQQTDDTAVNYVQHMASLLDGCKTVAKIGAYTWLTV